MKRAAIAALTALCIIASPAVRGADRTAQYDLKSSDFATLEDAISHGHVFFLVVADERMPKDDAIAHYVTAAKSEIGKPTIWIASSHAKLLDAAYTPSKEEHTAFIAALIASAMESGNAGSTWKQMYGDLLQIGKLDETIRALVPELDADHFTYVYDLGDPSDEQALFVAVTQQLAPGVPGVVPVLRPAKDLPGYDPLAYYTGWNTDPKYPGQGVIFINRDHVLAHGGSVVKDTGLLLPYLTAFVLATCDGGKAGPEWKRRYDAAAAADAALPASAADRYANRRKLALPIALKIQSAIRVRN